MKCLGGPLDGQERLATNRYLEAMTEDWRIAQYEAAAGAYVLKGHYVVTENNGEYARTFVPL